MPITKATLADAAELTQLVNSGYRGESSKKGWTTEANLLDGIRIDELTMIKYFQDPYITILKYTNDEGRIIGCVYLEVKGERLYLGMLTVSPILQANGIGRQLLHEAEIVATELKCNSIFMTVITVRQELIQWYVRRGYQATGEILPFHEGTRFGVPTQKIELAVLEKEV
ncbi:MAG TPA: GNAT family N-acetyltransferase [Mucilaginibacter sp.]|jgi:GNAT superfamily N-acetyltransferase|nr:GNAT family N-acetyltransferase [Mucilaginibacter sp.]